jgi:radical SAM protein with 4Fe4S-binding SPASM domain
MFDTSERPIVLVWELTRACELACDHCRADAQPERHPDELTTAEGKRLLESAAEFGRGQVVVLSGGDPLARPDVPELVAHGEEAGLRVSLTPSGTASLTDERVRSLAAAGLDRMALSFDGATAESHDAFRGETGSFASTRAAAEAARRAGIDLQVNTTVCAATVEELPGIRELVGELDAVRWSVFFLVPVGRGRKLDPVSPAQADAVCRWLHEVNREAPFDVKTTEAPQFRRVSLQERGVDPGDARRPSALAGDGFAFVSHTGEVFPSGFLPRATGNVRDRSVVDQYREADLFAALRDRDRLTGKCGACPYREVCGGSRSRAFATAGDPLASDPLCPFVPPGYDGPMPWDDDPTGGERAGPHGPVRREDGDGTLPWTDHDVTADRDTDCPGRSHQGIR